MSNFWLSKNVRNIPGWLATDELAYIMKCVWEASGMKGDLFEIGSYCGKSTVVIGECLKQGCSGILFTIDSHYFGIDTYGIDTYTELCNNLTKYELNDYVVVVKERSDDFIYNMSDDQKIKLLFIDGDHSYEQVALDVINYVPRLVKGGYLLFHDSKEEGVAKAISEMQKDDLLFIEQVNSLSVWRKK